MSQAVGIGVLVEDTGERARTLQHWSDLGILIAEPGTDKKGRGYHREFRAAPHYGERTIALLASAFSKIRVPLNDVKRLTEIFRRILDQDERKLRCHPFYAALTRDVDVFFAANLHLAWSSDPETNASFLFTPPITEDVLTPPLTNIELTRQLIASGQLPGDALDHLDLTNPRVVDRHPSPEFVLRMLIDFSRDRPESFLLNLTKILEPLRR